MAVAANDIALRDLRLDQLDATRLADQRADLSRLLCCVIELEHRRVGLTAVDACGLRQVRVDVFVSQLSTCSPCCSHLLEVQFAAVAEVRLEAVPAPPLVAVLVAVERFERERLFASLAPPLGHERMFPSDPDGTTLAASA
jgi:hypothetical protein